MPLPPQSKFEYLVPSLPPCAKFKFSFSCQLRGQLFLNRCLMNRLQNQPVASRVAFNINKQVKVKNCKQCSTQRPR
jgi:hypothetical protein